METQTINPTTTSNEVKTTLVTADVIANLARRGRTGSTSVGDANVHYKINEAGIKKLVEDGKSVAGQVSSLMTVVLAICEKNKDKGGTCSERELFEALGTQEKPGWAIGQGLLTTTQKGGGIYIFRYYRGEMVNNLKVLVKVPSPQLQAAPVSAPAAPAPAATSKK